MKHLDFTVTIGKFLLDARVDYADDSRHVREQSLHLHEHLLYEIYFIERGNLTLQCDKTTLSLKIGDILVIAPHVPHKILSHDPELVRFNVQFMGKVEGDAPYTFFCPPEPVKQEIFSLIKSIRRYMANSDNMADAYRINHAFSMLLSHVVEPMLPPDAFRRAVSKNSRLQQLIVIDQFFFDRYAEPITILDLATALNYSETQARRILQEYTGMSFADNLRRHRISAAKQYLLNSTFSIDEIAERCGYQSRMGFENVFKKLVGMSPHKFRANTDGQ